MLLELSFFETYVAVLGGNGKGSGNQSTGFDVYEAAGVIAVLHNVRYFFYKAWSLDLVHPADSTWDS